MTKTCQRYVFLHVDMMDTRIINYLIGSRSDADRYCCPWDRKTESFRQTHQHKALRLGRDRSADIVAIVTLDGEVIDRLVVTPE